MHEAGLEIDPAVITDILTGFIRRELEKTGLERLVVGLSGGLDSAVAAFLAARALGPKQVHAVLMPYRSSSRESLTDAALVVDALGIGSETVEITTMVESYQATGGEIDPLRLGNVMARCRMIVLYDLSARDHALVLGTSNKTEILLGYGTLYGDTASALNPIGDLYKTEVRQLARHLGVPGPVLAKPPSADLWPDQSDEDELGFTYEEIDPLLAMLVDDRVSPETAVKKGFSKETVDRVVRLITGSEFKRRMPVIAKVAKLSRDS